MLPSSFNTSETRARLLENEINEKPSEISLYGKSLENLMIISTESKMFSKIDLNQIINEIAATSTKIASDLFK